MAAAPGKGRQVLLATLDRDEHLVEMSGVSHPIAPAPQLPGVDLMMSGGNRYP